MEVIRNTASETRSHTPRETRHAPQPHGAAILFDPHAPIPTTNKHTLREAALATGGLGENLAAAGADGHGAGVGEDGADRDAARALDVLGSEREGRGKEEGVGRDRAPYVLSTPPLRHHHHHTGAPPSSPARTGPARGSHIPPPPNASPPPPHPSLVLSLPSPHTMKNEFGLCTRRFSLCMPASSSGLGCSRSTAS